MHSHDRVDLYLDPPLFHLLCNSEHHVDVRCGSTVFGSSLYEVRLRVERVTGYGHNVEIFAVRIQPSLCHFRPVVHDGTGLDVKLLFAVLEHLPDVHGLKKWLSAADIEFLHASISEEPECAFSFIKRENIVVRGGMKTKLAFVIADAMGKPVHGDWYESRLWSGSDGQ